MVMVKALCQLILKLCVVIVFLPCASYAACIVDHPITFNMRDILLTPSEKGTPGTVLYSEKIGIPEISYSCGTSVRSTWRSTFARPEFSRTSLDNVYSTGIAGIGIRIKWPESRGLNGWVPGAYQCQGRCIEPGDYLVVEFVQTGDSQSGVIAAGPLIEVNVSPDDNPTQQTTLLRLNNSTVTVQIRSCAIIASTNYIDLGDYSLADLKRTGVTVPKKDFQITLNCPSSSSAQIQFDGITAWGERALLKNNGSAEYVYVKLYNKFGSCARCYNEIALNEKINFGSAAPFTGSRSVNYAAEMFFNESTRDKMTAGTVDASVVFTLTIN